MLLNVLPEIINNNYMEEYIRQIGLGNNVNFINHGSGKYELRHKEKNFGRPIARLRFELKNGELKITGGNTTHSYRGEGYGSTLRALATKAGQMLGAQRGKHEGFNVENRSVERASERAKRQAAPEKLKLPTSTYIMREELGWHAPEGGNTSTRPYISVFNYSKNNMSKVNRYLQQLQNNLARL